MSSHKKRSLSVSTERLRLRGNMKKSELKNFVQIYAEIKNALIKRSDVVEIIKRNRKVRVKIKPWMYKFPEFLNLVEKSENHTVREIIRRNIENGEKDLTIWQSVALSESTYYRWKKQIVDKIYNLYVLAGDVRLEEILEGRIE